MDDTKITISPGYSGIIETVEKLVNENERLRKALFVIASRNVFEKHPMFPDEISIVVWEARVEWLRDKAVEALEKGKIT